MNVDKLVIEEINAVRLEHEMPALAIDPMTPLENIEFDSVMYITLIIRIEEKLQIDIFRRHDREHLPSTVGDVAKLFLV